MGWLSLKLVAISLPSAPDCCDGGRVCCGGRSAYGAWRSAYGVLWRMAYAVGLPEALTLPEHLKELIFGGLPDDMQ